MDILPLLARLRSPASCGSGSSDVTPQTQIGAVNATFGDAAAEVVTFGFRPDGASPDQTGSSAGTRTLTWSDAIEWARCDRAGDDCRWYETGGAGAPGCLRAGQRVQVAWVETKPLGDGPGQQLLAWMKCLGD